MSYAFISHAVKADGAFAMRLANDLRAHNLLVWKAPESIKPGERWAQAIESAVETCDTMLTILTPEAVESRWVSTEMNMAIEREHEGKMTVVPLDLKACKVPRMWAQYQRISFNGSYETGLKELLKRLGISSRPKEASTDSLGLGSKRFWELLGRGQSTENIEPSCVPFSPASETPSPLKIRYPWDKYLDPKEAQNAASGSLADIFKFTNYSPLEVSSEESLGDHARKSFDDRKAIKHYTKAIESYESNQTLLKSEWHKKALGAIYYKRGQSWMGLDLWNSLGKVDLTPPLSPRLSRPKKLYSGVRYNDPLGGYTFGMFPSLLQVQAEYTNAQADFAKAKELGYQPDETAGKK